MTSLYQPGILDGVPAVARYVQFGLADKAPDAQAIKDALGRLSPLANGSDVVVGVGPSLAAALGADVPGLHEFPDLSGHGVKVPSTPGVLWCWVRGSDLGDLLHLTRKVQKALAPVFVVRHVVDAFRHALGESGHGKDLTGYEDGTENPTGEAAEEAALGQPHHQHRRHGHGPEGRIVNQRPFAPRVPGRHEATIVRCLPLPRTTCGASSAVPMPSGGRVSLSTAWS